MAARDQEMRFSDSFDETVDQANTARLKEIVAEVGWPTISRVGVEASFAAWLLVQHADHDLSFQKECLSLMQEALSQQDVLSRNVAYLIDRVRVNEGKKQLYGTQYYEDERGAFGPRPVEHEEELDKRREEVGLEPMAVYDVQMRENYTRE